MFQGRTECGVVSFAGPILSAIGSVASTAGPILHAGSTLMQAFGSLEQGKEARKIAEAEAVQFEKRGRMSLALGSLQAQRLRKSTERVRSRANAVLAASGFATDDATGRAIDEGIVREGSMQELLAVAQAQDEHNQDMYRAALRRRAGKQAQSAAMYDAASTLVSGAFSWRDRFGGAADTGTPASTSAGGSRFPPPFEGDWGTPPFVPG